MALMYLIFAFATFWLLAVFKVFILNDGKSLPTAFVTPAIPSMVTNKIEMPRRPLISSSGGGPKGKKTLFLSKREEKANADSNSANNNAPSSVMGNSPASSEWMFIRSDRRYKQETGQQQQWSQEDKKPLSISVGTAVIAKSDTQQQQQQQQQQALLPGQPPPLSGTPREPPHPDNVISATELKWPPVQPGFVIPEKEGFDVMPLLGLHVPRFWYPPPDQELNTIGRKVNGEETIFLMIASYRDFQCRETITSAYMRADHPERLFVGAVDQLVPGDVGCLDIDIPCTQDPTQMICKYRDQISVYKMDAQYATGPVTARHIGDRMYRGETYVMQMDAHCLFINHWDKLIINQFKSTGNEMAVLSSYLTDVQGSITPAGESTRNTRPIMCNSDFEGQMPARYLRHGSQPEMMATIKDMPQLQPFWAAGFSFSRGHFKVRVPYDAYQPMVFQGEEIAIGIRAFTHGYDLYAPKDSVVFHEYAEKSSRRKKIHMFW